MYNVRIGLKNNTVMDVASYDIAKHIYNGADGKKYTLDDIEYFIVSKDEFVKLQAKEEKKEKVSKKEKDEIKSEVIDG